MTGARDLTIINNNAGNEVGLAALLKAGRVRKMICSFPRVDSQIFDDPTVAAKWSWSWCRRGNRARGSGRRRAGAVFTPTGYGTPLAEGKETREIDGRHVLEYPIKADFALIKAHQATAGATGLSQGGAQLWPDHGDSGETTIVEVSQLVALRPRPGKHHHPGIFVQRVFSLENLTAAQRA